MSRIALLTIMIAGLLAGSDGVYAGPADDAFAVAASHYARQRWQAAADEFRSLLETSPRFTRADDARFYLAESLVQLREYHEAAGVYEKLLADAPKYRYAKLVLFRQGETAFLLKRVDAARTALEQFQRLYPDDSLNAYVGAYLGELALGAGEPARAQQVYTASLERYPDGPMADKCRFGLGRALEMQNDTAGAKRFFTLLADNHANTLAADAHLELALLHYRAGEPASVVEMLTPFSERFPQTALHATARYWLGIAHLDQGQWDRAATTLMQAAEGTPGQPGSSELAPAALFRAADAWEKLRDLPAAQAACRQILDQWPESPWADDALETRTRLALAQNDYPESLLLAEEFTTRFPNSPLLTNVRQMQGRALLRQDRTDEAIAIFEALAKPAGVPKPATSPVEAPTGDRIGSADASLGTNRYLLGLAYLASQRDKEAVATLSGIPLETASAELRSGTLIALARALAGCERPADAVVTLRSYLAEFPESPAADAARRDLVIALLQSRQLTLAVSEMEAWQAGSEESGLWGESLLLVAEASYEAGEFAEAASLFQRLAGSDVANATLREQVSSTAESSPRKIEFGTPEPIARALSGLGWSRFKLEEWDAAQAAFGQLIGQYPTHALAQEGRLMHARALDQMGDLETALSSFDHVIRQQPASESAAEALAASTRLLQRAGRLREAIVLAERLVNEHADFSRLDVAIYQLAWDLNDIGQPETADHLFQRLHTLHRSSPYWPDATFRLAERAARSGDRAEARRLVEMLLTSDGAGEIRRHGLFLSGQLAVNDHRWADVATAMQQLVEEFPDSELQLAAEYWLAESLFRRGEFDEAGPRFATLAAAAAESREPWMAMIPLRQAQLHARAGQWPEAFEIATALQHRFESLPQQYELDYLLGRCHVSRAEMDEARAAFDRVLQSPDGSRTEVAAMAQWMTGETFFLQKRYDEAMRAYHRVEALHNFPRWQAAALFQAGKCHELKRQTEQAVRLYRQVAQQFPTTMFAEQAAERLRSLGRE